MERVGVGNRLSFLLLTGFLISFFLERLLWILFRGSGTAEHSGHSHLDSESFHHGHERERKGHTGLIGNILFGGTVHSFMDGMAIATSFLVGHTIGVATTIAVLLNSVATFGCALGGVLVLVYGDAVALPIAAANFLYIATGILLPELQKEKKSDPRSRGIARRGRHHGHGCGGTSRQGE